MYSLFKYYIKKKVFVRRSNAAAPFMFLIKSKLCVSRKNLQCQFEGLNVGWLVAAEMIKAGECKNYTCKKVSRDNLKKPHIH